MYVCVFVCVQEAALQIDVDFWISVCCRFEVSEQLISLVNILNFLLQLPDDKDDNGESRDDGSGISSHQRSEGMMTAGSSSRCSHRKQMFLPAQSPLILCK